MVGVEECGKDGTCACGFWRKLSLLGRGAHGSVYLGRLTKSGELVAVKQVLVNKRVDREMTGAVVQEIGLTRSLSHVHIVRYLGTHQCGSCLNIFLEYCPRGSLRHMLQSEERQTGIYTRQILMGLRYLHENGIAHRHPFLLPPHDQSRIGPPPSPPHSLASNRPRHWSSGACGVPTAPPPAPLPPPVSTGAGGEEGGVSRTGARGKGEGGLRPLGVFSASGQPFPHHSPSHHQVPSNLVYYYNNLNHQTGSYLNYHGPFNSHGTYNNENLPLPPHLAASPPSPAPPPASLLPRPPSDRARPCPWRSPQASRPGLPVAVALATRDPYPPGREGGKEGGAEGGREGGPGVGDHGQSAAPVRDQSAAPVREKSLTRPSRLGL
ncbi:hypothetical protein NSK_002035 [Nannochloropsis salina CCMP1776]|uniref:Protein kinase domain-containing protein n=1 Tax=Nannochloropsis salina CCMP1776 TaxID=1027361 RepID=A0A4D9D982_9STRA|nr:hypothetical protein NSK_002035 [Nannochloropsis salina CCMP1776]|eukprot:TFJ86947.1 hypothetical protein NSK_002035 [Nannochloropsis salina CCMP1776]